MADFTAKDVQALRQQTGAGMMDAKRALQENGGDPTAAAKWLREQGLSKAQTREGRENTQGAVAVSTTENVAAVGSNANMLAGWVVMLGAMGAALTVRVAGVLVTLPLPVFVTPNV